MPEHNEDIPYWIEDLDEFSHQVNAHYGNLINDKPKVSQELSTAFHNEFSAPRHALSLAMRYQKDIVERLCLGLAGMFLTKKK
ncbi:hypothetical protein SPFM12_00063 [Salmonella phage SPFM12]|nr:hypothetical protein SPFM12_00063 [Salmonella phage SPFM12]